MKKITLLFIYLLSNITYSQSNFEFEALSNLISKRGLITTTSSKNKLFAANGFTPVVSFSTDIEMYDIENNNWTILSSSTIGKRFANIEAIDNNLYLFNGQIIENNGTDNIGYNKKLEKINITSKNISLLTENPFPVKSAGNCVWNNEIYFFGGYNSQGYSNKLIKYNLENDNWIELKEMSIAKETRGEVVNGKIYTIGGFNGANGLTSIDSYDIVSNTWEQLINLPIGISAHSTAVFEDKILIIGDYSNQTNIGYYDITNNTYISYTSNMIGRRHFGSENVDGNLYLIGGNQTPNASSSLNSLQVTNLSTTLSVLENNLESFKIFPNPIEQFLHISYNYPIKNLTLTNILGKEILKLNELPSNKKLNLSNLKSGMYFLSIKTEKLLITKKIMKK